MTTTGSSVLTDIPGLPRSLLMWRQFSQWLGGMGIIVLALAVLPRLRVGGRQLMESEAPGPELETLTASIRDTARRLWFLYVGLTALMILILATFGWTGIDERMHLFDAVGNTFAAMPTGGFGVDPRSVEPYAPASQWVIAALHGDRRRQLRAPLQARSCAGSRSRSPATRSSVSTSALMLARLRRPHRDPLGRRASARARRRSGRPPSRRSRS